MGAADVVPGVSGGTIAFISGIYDELVDSIRAVNLPALKTLVFRGPAAFWRQINGTFLLVLFAGILASVFSLARVIRYLLEHHPIHVWSFFFGLILASVVYMARRQPRRRMPQVAGFLFGAGAALAVAFSPPLAIAASPVSLFLAGMLAICAMILPGISGSFILLLLGIYPVIIAAVSDLEFSLLGIFALGAVLGLMLFSRLLSWLLHRHRATTLSVLIGFLAGSLVVVWPWQQQTMAGGAEWSRTLMWPGAYEKLVGESHVGGAVLLILVSMALVLGLECLGDPPGQE